MTVRRFGYDQTYPYELSAANACTTLARAGDVSDGVFSLLCMLDAFNLDGNPGINTKTIAGYLACYFSNLKDQTELDLRYSGLGGAWYDQTYPPKKD